MFFLRKTFNDFGGITSSTRPERTEAETDAMIKDFIGKLVPKLQRPGGGALLEGTTLSKSTL